MSTFIDLTNLALTRMNEENLTAANFATARGVHAHARDAVNASIKHIARRHPQWPFYHKEFNDVLLAGEQTYALPKNLYNVDMNTFRIEADTVNNVQAKTLSPISYDTWTKGLRERDINGGTDARAQPTYVFRTQGMSYGVSPIPDKSYNVTFEYWIAPKRLVNATDETEIPEAFDDVIVSGAHYYMTIFRADNEAAILLRKTFEDGLKDMGQLLLRRDEYVESTMTGVVGNGIGGSYIGF